jgi:hypothetical protein
MRPDGFEPPTTGSETETRAFASPTNLQYTNASSRECAAVLKTPQLTRFRDAVRVAVYSVR